MTVATATLRGVQRQAVLDVARLNAESWHLMYMLHVKTEPCCDAGRLCRFGQELNDAADAEGRRVMALEGYL